jgi:hypothetical protein
MELTGVNVVQNESKEVIDYLECSMVRSVVLRLDFNASMKILNLLIIYILVYVFEKSDSQRDFPSSR